MGTGSTIRWRSASPVRTPLRGSHRARVVPMTAWTARPSALTGSCRDVAGNVTPRASRSTTTPRRRPSPTSACCPVIVVSSHVGLVTVRRGSCTVRKAASAQSVIYRGAVRPFVDRRLKNGRRYRYADHADRPGREHTSDRVSAVPTPRSLLLPRTAPSFRSAPEPSGRRQARQLLQRATIFRGLKVLTRWPVTNRLQLDERWNSLGRRHHRLVVATAGTSGPASGRAPTGTTGACSAELLPDERG